MALTFATKVDYAVGDRPTDVAVTDVSGDGIVDIITSNYNDGSVSILTGIGDGLFTAASVASTRSQSNDLVVADINADTIPDLITIGSSENINYVSVLINNSLGVFDATTPISLPIPNSLLTPPSTTPYPILQSVAVGDFNADGFNDIVVILASRDLTKHDFFSTYVYQNNQDGTFSDASQLALGGEPYDVITTDVNADGMVDIVTANRASSSVSILKGNGDGTFGAVTKMSVGMGPTTVAVGDVNNDGNLDLVTSNYTAKTISVYPGNGKGLFGVAPTLFMGVNSSAVALGDMDKDGKLDIVTANADGSVSVATGNGDKTFATPIIVMSATAGATPSGLTLQDVNSDSLLDIIVSNQDSDSVSVLLNTSNGVGVVTKIGTAKAETLTGDSSNDILQGLGGNDTLLGNAGDDQLFGGAGKDKLFGGDGNDILVGGSGSDVLTGGSGKDIFQLVSAYNVDKISDFLTVDDTLQLDNAIFSALEATGTLAADFFHAGAGFTSAADANDYLIYNTKTGVLYYDEDAKGTDSVAVKIAILGTTTHPDLTAADFVVI